MQQGGRLEVVPAAGRSAQVHYRDFRHARPGGRARQRIRQRRVRYHQAHDTLRRGAGLAAPRRVHLEPRLPRRAPVPHRTGEPCGQPFRSARAGDHQPPGPRRPAASRPQTDNDTHARRSSASRATSRGSRRGHSPRVLDVGGVHEPRKRSQSVRPPRYPAQRCSRTRSIAVPIQPIFPAAIIPSIPPSTGRERPTRRR